MNVFINFVPEALIFPQPGRDICRVSIPCIFSDNGYLTITVFSRHLLPARKKDGSSSPGFRNIFLGKKDGIRQASIKMETGLYAKTEFTNKTIANMFNSEREEYKNEMRMHTDQTAK